MQNIIILCLVITGLFAPINSFARENSTLYSEVEYGTDEKQMLDIYVPSSANPQKYPVHIFVHGGAWRIGDKERSKNHGEFYNKQGIIFVSVNYRLSPEHQHPAHTQDVAQAIKWVHKNISAYNGDINNIHLSGHSAGAHLVALIGTDPRYLNKHNLPLSTLKTVIPVDTASFDLTATREGKGSRLINRSIKKSFGTNPKTLIAASPLKQSQISENAPHFILFVTAERPDAVKETQQFHRSLKQARTQSELHIINGFSHGDMNKSMSQQGSEISNTILSALKNH